MINSIGENNKNIISDVRSERLFRAAEDDFFYLKSPDEAKKKLLKTLDYTPFMTKSILMLASIYILEGKLKDALAMYKEVEKFMPDNMKVLAGIANTYEMLNDNRKALKYVDMAIGSKDSRYSPLVKSLVELKAVILLKLNKVEDVRRFVADSRAVLSLSECRELQANLNLKIKNRLKLNKRIQQGNLQLVK